MMMVLGYRPKLLLPVPSVLLMVVVSYTGCREVVVLNPFVPGCPSDLPRSRRALLFALCLMIARARSMMPLM